MRIFKGHRGKIGANALTYSPDGSLLASGGEDGAVRFWDLAKGEEAFAFALHWHLVTGLGFLAGGRVLVSSSWDDTVRFWDVARRKQVKRFETDSGTNCLAVSRDGRQVAVAGAFTPSFNQSVHRWQFDAVPKPRFKTLPQIVFHENQIGAVAYSPDGRLLATGSADRTTRVWDLEEGVLRYRWTSRAWIQGVTFSPDGKTLAIAAGRQVSLRALDDGHEQTRLSNHRHTAMSVAWSPDRRLVVSGGKDGAVCCWDAALGRVAAIYRWKIGPVEAIAFSPDGMTAAAGGDGDIAVWDVDA